MTLVKVNHSEEVKLFSFAKRPGETSVMLIFEVAMLTLVHVVSN